AHLRDDLRLRRRLGDGARLPDGVAKWLFAVDVLAQLERRERGEGVGVFRRADHDGVELPGVVDQLAEVVVGAGLRELLGGLAEAGLVHVAEGDDVLAGDLLGVGRAAAAGADDGDVQLLVRRAGRRRLAVRRQPEAGAGQGRLFEEVAAGA